MYQKFSLIFKILAPSFSPEGLFLRIEKIQIFREDLISKIRAKFAKINPFRVHKNQN